MCFAQAITNKHGEFRALQAATQVATLLCNLQKHVACVATQASLCLQQECQFLCRHMYHCDPTCYDYSNGHICKHIHRIHTVARYVQCRNPDNEGQLDLLEQQEDDSSGEGMDYTSCADHQRACMYSMHVCVVACFLMLMCILVDVGLGSITHRAICLHKHSFSMCTYVHNVHFSQCMFFLCRSYALDFACISSLQTMHFN